MRVQYDAQLSGAPPSPASPPDEPLEPPEELPPELLDELLDPPELLLLAPLEEPLELPEEPPLPDPEELLPEPLDEPLELLVPLSPIGLVVLELSHASHVPAATTPATAVNPKTRADFSIDHLR